MISIVLTHYNKGLLLNRTIDSLQPLDSIVHEIIVVDDCSTDPNWAMNAELLTKSNNKIKIIQNNDNKGPATRLNQGADLATGDYIFFMDADDILAPDRLKDILGLMKNSSCDLFYGNKVKIRDISESRNFPTIASMTIVKPLTYMLEHNIMEMCVMCTRELWKNSSKCNQHLFIQDESLALELGYVSNKLLFTETPTVFVILDEDETKVIRGKNRLSRNLNQQHHDMFFTIYDFLSSKQLDHKQQNLLKMKALSTYWKSLKFRNQTNFIEFIFYVLSKYNPKKYWDLRSEKMKKYFMHLGQVRSP